MMKSIKKIINLILIAIIVAIPSFLALAASPIEVPISVEWTYEGKPWANSPHTANVVILPQNEAPSPKKANFDHAGNYIIHFQAPVFTSPGKYEYIIKQTNKDFKEENYWVTYDKTIYRLIFYVQESNGQLKTVAYAYNEKDYNPANPKGSKVAKILFTNDDPHIHRHDGTIIDEDNNHPNLPIYPTNPADPTNSNNPPLEPNNPDRNDQNTPIYTTEPEDGQEDKVINPEPWEKPDQPTPPTPTPPGPGPNPDDGTDGNNPFPWWPWRPTPNPTDPEDPTKPVDPTEPTDPDDTDNPIDNQDPDKTDDQDKPTKPTDPEDTDNTDDTNKPVDPTKPTDPENPTNPVEPTEPTDPTNPPDDGNTDKPSTDSTGDSTVDKENPTQPNPGDSDINDPIKENKTEGPKIPGKNKTSHTNVQTGIESVALWAIVLVLALTAYSYIAKDKNKVRE